MVEKNIQQYRLYFPRDMLKTLSSVSLKTPLLHISINWMVILASWLTASTINNFFISSLLIFIIATQLYALKIIGHDAFHLRLSKNLKVNNLVADILINAPIFTINRINRANHMEHHNSLPGEDDPDRHKYNPSLRGGIVEYLFFLSGLKNFSTAFSNVFLPNRHKGSNNKKSLGYKPTDILLIVSWQLILVTLLTVLFGWHGYLAFWIIPMYIGPYMLNMIRSFAEHAMIYKVDQGYDGSRLVTYTPNWLERQIIAPHNMNYHAEHHLWPSIPYYKLTEAHKNLKKFLKNDDDIFFRKSYFAFLVEYYRGVR